MTPLPGVRRLFRLATGRSTAEEDLKEELRLHLQLAAEELIEQGMAPEAARAEAARRFGDVGGIHRATAKPCMGPQERVLRTRNSRVPCSRSTGWLAMALT